MILFFLFNFCHNSNNSKTCLDFGIQCYHISSIASAHLTFVLFPSDYSTLTYSFSFLLHSQSLLSLFYDKICKRFQNFPIISQKKRLELLNKTLSIGMIIKTSLNQMMKLLRTCTNGTIRQMK